MPSPRAGFAGPRHPLRRHFIDQAIDNDAFGSTADARRWSVAIVGLIGLIGGAAAAALLQHAPEAARLAGPEAVRAFSRPDRIMAITAAMVGSGLLGCVIWPWMVVDRRDVEILTGLPLSATGIVTAKLLALCAIVLVFTAGTHLPASIVFGQTVSTTSSLAKSAWSAAAHLLVQVAAGVFVFLFIAASQAVALVFVGPRSFLKFSAVVQATLTAVIAAAITYAPDLYFRARADLREFAGPLPAWLAHGPVGWFLGAYDVLLGSRDSADVQLAVNAAIAFGACVVVIIPVYPVMYQRLVRVAVEQPKRRDRRHVTSLVERVSQWLARDPAAQAASEFVLISVARSSRHRQTVAIAVGLAATYCLPSVLRWWPHLAAPPARPPAELLSVPIQAMLILAAGLLLATALPAEPGARWAWLTTDADRRGLRSAVRRVTFLLAVVPVVAVMTPMYWLGWGPLVALSHAAVCAAVGALVIAVSTIRRCTLPCAWPLAGPGPAVPVMIASYLGAYWMFTDWFPAQERLLFDSPAMLAAVLGGLVLAGLAVRGFDIGRAARVNAQRVEQGGI